VSATGTSGVLRLLGAVLFLGLALTGLLVYPALSRRLDLEHHAALGLAFYLAGGALLLSLSLFSWRGGTLIASLLRVAREKPRLATLFLVNAAVFCLLVLKLATAWGLVACLLAAAVLLIRYGVIDEQRREAALSRTLDLSPLTFLMVYLLLGAGEVLLHLRPAWCGTGGGGNPALAQLYAGLYSYNSDGLRDDEVEVPAPSGELRILALGDSFTFGQGVASEDCFPVQLERELQESCGSGGSGGSGRIRVINAGKAAANTDWEFRYLESRGARYEPDLVLIQFYANDVEAREYAIDPAGGETQRTWMSPINRLFSRSYILFFLRDHFDRAVEAVRRRFFSDVPPDYLWTLVERARRNDLGWRRCLESFERFAHWSRARRVPIVVSLWPHPGERHEGVAELHARLGEHLKRLGLPAVDLTGVIDRIDPARQIAHAFDHHPGPEYHRAAARRIAAFLRDQGLLDD